MYIFKGRGTGTASTETPLPLPGQSNGQATLKQIFYFLFTDKSHKIIHLPSFLPSETRKDTRIRKYTQRKGKPLRGQKNGEMRIVFPSYPVFVCLTETKTAISLPLWAVIHKKTKKSDYFCTYLHLLHLLLLPLQMKINSSI